MPASPNPGVANGVLPLAVGVVNVARAHDRAAIMDGLFEDIEHEACMRCLARAPTDDPACAGVDDER